MSFIEAPTTFYLGRRVDADTRQVTSDVVYYDARDLVTHAVVMGMTGSGKTGLCIDLLEEAVLDNIPAIIIDPKGDITNLLLTFPDFRPEDFLPWVNIDDARRAGVDVPTFAQQIAGKWQSGLNDWGIVADRLRWLKGIAQYSIYTPGSDAGLPISILASLAAPREGWAGNEEALREKINGTVTALLALIGLNVQPVKDKEHVLVANIFEYNWQRGVDLTLETIITQVQKPPFVKLGVLAIDDYMSEKARFKLAMAMNSIVAAPSFQSWINGEPLNIQSLLYQPNGRARVSVFYIAHLNDAERQFIVTLLLENMLGWMRSQSGTTSLRALLYIDEMFGYFPPYPYNPPSKDPILRLLKQARAFGLGLILATQNPADLDYKGLSNAGTWFIGKLQSENDRSRVMAGLESLASASASLNLRDVERLVADLQPRVFLMHNVHEDTGPQLVYTRWTMSYLRGPLTRQQVGQLMAGQKQALLAKLAATGHQAPPPMQLPNAPPALPDAGALLAQTVPTNIMPAAPRVTTQAAPPVAASNAPQGFSVTAPGLPASTVQFFIPAKVSVQQAVEDWRKQTNAMIQRVGAQILAYRPVLLAQTAVRYQDKKTQLYTAHTYTFLVPDVEKSGLVHWEQFVATPLNSRELSSEPFGAAIYADMPAGLTDSKRLAALKAELTDMLYTTAKIQIPYNPTLDIYGKPDADVSEYWAQVQQVAREKRDAEIDALAKKVEGLIDKLEERIRRKERELSAERKEVADLKREEFFTKGEMLVGLFKGRTTHTLSRSTRVSRYRRQASEQLNESEEVIAELEDEIAKVQERFEADIQVVNDKWAKVAAEAQAYTVAPLKKDIQAELYGIGWVPYYYVEINAQPLLLPGYY